jgi:hypothetical protein
MFIPRDEDYGVVTPCRHPYLASDDYSRVAFLVAGAHLPGTMYGVRLLGRAKESFRERPFGGIFNLRLDPRKRWEERLLDRQPEWSTEPYLDAPGLIEKFKDFRQKAELVHMEPTDVDQTIAFLHHLGGGTADGKKKTRARRARK